MQRTNGKQVSTRLLIIYLISALLFLTSFRLHIHPQDGSVVSADTGSLIHVSAITGDILSPDQDDEISISPSGVLKAGYNNHDIIVAVFMLAILLTLQVAYACIARIRDSHTRVLRLPFFGTPALRAPPFYNS